MPEEKTLDFRRYRSAKLAGRLEQPYQTGAIERFVAGLDGGNDGRPSIDYILSQEDGPKKIMGIYANEYNRAIGRETIGGLSDLYNDFFGEYFQGEQLNRIRDELAKYSDEKFGDIDREVKQAQHLIEGAKKGIYSKEEAEEALKTIEKYRIVLSLLEIAEDKEIESLREDAIEAGRKCTLDSLVREAA